MGKEEFIKYLAKKNRRPQHHYAVALTEILQGVSEQLVKGKDVSFIGFGTFYTRIHKGGTALNFKTKKQVEYMPVRQVAFHPGSLLKQKIRGKK